MSNIITAVKGIIYCKGRLLIVKRSEEDTSGSGDWEFPGGKIDFGESPENALKREVYEETGLDVRICDIAYADTFMTSPVKQVIIICYFCITDTDCIELSAEHCDYKWVLTDKLEENICDNFKSGVNLNRNKIREFCNYCEK
ncbi:MAG: NUDIX domain-containing protein [Ruminococcus sp.]|jgi:8-oxo-dGTP diphosphatase|nr:NUDIX domain-containing protein [Ruminococcus sp.]